MEDRNVESVLKIFAVSLNGPQKGKAYAVYDRERLVITHFQVLSGEFDTWEENLAEEMCRRRTEGFLCIGEEMPDHLAEYASSQFLLEAMDESGRSNLCAVLDWFFDLLHKGNMIVSAEYQQYMTHLGQQVEKTRDDKGRVTYSINWDAINEEHRAILLCVAAAMIGAVIYRYTEEMIKAGVPKETLIMVKLATILAGKSFINIRR